MTNVYLLLDGKYGLGAIAKKGSLSYNLFKCKVNEKYYSNK